MQIQQITNNFSATKIQQKKHQNTNTQQALNNFKFDTASSDAIRSYVLGTVNFGSESPQNKGLIGIQGITVQANPDRSELLLKMKSPLKETAVTKLIYQVNNEKTPREAFALVSNNKTGIVDIKLPVLNRKDNTLFSQIKILGISYMDEGNKVIGTEEAAETPQTIKISEHLNYNPTRTTLIDGDVKDIKFDSISEGKVEGKLIPISYEDILRYQGEQPIIGLLNEMDFVQMMMNVSTGTFTLPHNVKGVIATMNGFKVGSGITDALGHAVSRLRHDKIFAVADNNLANELSNKFLQDNSAPFIHVELSPEKLSVKGISNITPPSTCHVNVPKYEFVREILAPNDERFKPETVGLKAYNLKRLQNIQLEGGFKVPNFIVIPAGVVDDIKHDAANIDTYGEDSKALNAGLYHINVHRAATKSDPSLELKLLRNLISDGIIIPKEIRTSIKEMTEQYVNPIDAQNPGQCFIARSSFNGEDSATFATQGLYDSFPGLRTEEDLFSGIKKVWASKWSDLAYWSRRNHGIDHGTIQPNVIVQNVVPVDYTFTINTADPRRNDKNKIIIQLSQGVYSGFPNAPYLFEYDKTTKTISRLALSTKKRMFTIDGLKLNNENNLGYHMTDYSKDALNLGKKDYEPIISKIVKVAEFIEKNMNDVPQDIEGGIIFKEDEKEPDVHIWQTRDVHLKK